MLKKRLFTLLTLLLVFSLVACGGDAATTGDDDAVVEDDVADDDVDTGDDDDVDTGDDDDVVEDDAPEKVQIRWFVGLGAGSDEGTFEAQEAVVDAFNESQDSIELVLEIVDNPVAPETLATQIAGGNAPDIVGPVGVNGRDQFYGAWLDLQPMIDAANYDLSAFDPSMVEFYYVQEQGQIGIPFGIFPSFTLYNIDLFDEAGLEYPPTEFGADYVLDGEDVPWDMDTLREIGMRLTVDVNGNDATSEDFDPENIVQFGFLNQYTDPRGHGSYFGSGQLFDADGNAVIPEPWYDAWKWTYEGMWEDWFIPNAAYETAEFIGGNPFQSGNIAMVNMHTWFMADWAFDGTDFDFNIAAVPSYNGTITAKMHGDTFGIMKSTEHPEEAFEVLTYLLSEEVAPDLLNIYGGMPARVNIQDTWLTEYYENTFPGKDINTQVIVDSMAYADNPNHESWLPSFAETVDRYNEFWNKLRDESGLDFDAEVEALLTDLQAIFDAWYAAN